MFHKKCINVVEVARAHGQSRAHSMSLATPADAGLFAVMRHEQEREEAVAAGVFDITQDDENEKVCVCVF